MCQAEAVYIVRRGNEWMVGSGEHDEYQIRWSIYLYDARRFTRLDKAKRAAKKYGGVAYRFVPVSGTVESVNKCCGCSGYRGICGECRNPRSEYYGVPVGSQDICREWEAKESWTKRTSGFSS